jgi:hypothetical protein
VDAVPPGHLRRTPARRLSFAAPASDTERLLYAYSVLCCLPSAIDDHTSAATGTVMRQATFEAYAKKAGFDGVSVLPIEHDFLRVLPARPLAHADGRLRDTCRVTLHERVDQ